MRACARTLSKIEWCFEAAEILACAKDLGQTWLYGQSHSTL
jgi:hypothetical protein